MGRTVRCVFLVLGAGLATPAFSQQTVGMTSEGASGFFTLSSADTLPKGTWAIGIRAQDWDRVADQTSRQADERSGLHYALVRSALAVSFGVSNRVELFASMPYDSIEGSQGSSGGLINGVEFRGRVDESDWGDLRLGGKWRLASALGGELAVSGLIWIPIVDSGSGISTGDSRAGLRVAWSRPGWVVDVGYADGLESGRQPAEVRLGVGYAHSFSKTLDWITEAEAVLPHGGGVEPEDVLDLTTGARVWVGETGRWSVDVALRTELVQALDGDRDPPLSYFLGVSFFPSLFDFP